MRVTAPDPARYGIRDCVGRKVDFRSPAHRRRRNAVRLASTGKWRAGSGVDGTSWDRAEVGRWPSFGRSGQEPPMHRTPEEKKVLRSNLAHRRGKAIGVVPEPAAPLGTACMSNL